MSLTSFITGEQDPESFYNNVERAPDPTQQAYKPQTDNANTYTAQQIGPNALAGANGDTGGQAAQRGALARLQTQARGGLNDSDKASLYQAQNQLAQQNRGAQGAILQGAEARGGGNAGSTLAAQLAAQQGNQEAGATAAVDVAGQAANRAQQANLQAGELGGNIDQAAFAKEATVGQAQNALNAANAGAANKASEFNAVAQNTAQQFNIGNDIESKKFLALLLQQKYDNQLREAAARAGLSLQESGQDLDVIKSGAQAAGQAAGQAVGAGAGYSHGGEISGQASVPGDSEKNDTVPAMLSPGEIVIPRSATGSPHRILAFLEKETGMHFDSAMRHASKAVKLKS